MIDQKDTFSENNQKESINQKFTNDPLSTQPSQGQRPRVDRKKRLNQCKARQRELATSPDTKDENAQIANLDAKNLSFRLYFHFLRSGFVMMVFLGFTQVIPLFMRFSFGCTEYRELYGDQECPITYKVVYGEPFFNANVNANLARIELYKEIFSKNWLFSHFCLLLMIVTYLCASIHEKLILEEYSAKLKVSDRRVMICNLWNSSTSEGLVRYLQNLCQGSRIDVVSVHFANAGIGNMNRRRRILSVQQIIHRLELDLVVVQGRKKETKIVTKLIKEYKKWLKVTMMS